MKRILFVQGSVNPPGGGNAIAAWMLQALAPDHDVTLLCSSPPRWADIDGYYGTTLRANPPPVRLIQRALPRLPLPLRFARGALLQRTARALAPAFDVVVGADCEADIGRRGISYVHFPTDHLTRSIRDQPWWRAARPLSAIYTRSIERLTGYDIERMRKAPMLANSRWTADRIERAHGARPRVLYPPAAGEFPTTPWVDRLDAVVNVGRFSHEKRHAMVIDIVERARATGRSLSLTIVGTTWQASHEAELRDLAASRHWVRIIKDISRADLVRLLSTHRYGVHGMEDEHFGMAPAEMVRAGCIVFVPRSGGQVEIVDGDERLTFASAEEGAAKLSAAMLDCDRQRELLAALAPLRDRFTPERFCSEFRAVIREAAGAE